MKTQYQKTEQAKPKEPEIVITNKNEIIFRNKIVGFSGRIGEWLLATLQFPAKMTDLENAPYWITVRAKNGKDLRASIKIKLWNEKEKRY